MKTIVSIALCLALLLPGSAAAARLALVVGINEYENIAPLSKAVGDAEAMAATLTNLGFEVTKVLNPDRRELNQAVTAFRRSLSPGDAALVHFSGHGVEVNGRNLLLPKDIPEALPGEEDYLIEEALDLGKLIDRVAESGAGVRIFIIDACRRNPLEALAQRGFDRLEGLAPLDPPKGSFVLYSAGTRQSALDNLGADDPSPTSVYTRVLLEKLQEPGLTLSQIAREVRVEVAALAVTVGHTQSPAYYDELNEEFVLLPEVPAPVPAPPPIRSDDAKAFELAKSFNTVAAWQAFLKTYQTGFYADLARVALEELLEREAGATEVVATAPEGVVATFGFPLSGVITGWQLYFAFDTECENDHYAAVTSPTGRRLIVMDRGLHRCSGGMVTFDSLNSNDGGAFLGSEARGEWTFSMKDLDANEHSGVLKSVWMKLTVRNEGVTSEYKVTLDGLPRAIPNPGNTGVLESDHLAVRFAGELPATFRVKVTTNEADCPTCLLGGWKELTVLKDVAEISVPLPRRTTRVCVAMDESEPRIDRADLVMRAGHTISSLKGRDLKANGRSACSNWEVDAREAKYLTLTLKSTGGVDTGPDLGDASDVRQQLDALWRKGLDLSYAGNGAKYLETMQEAESLAESYFGPNSLEYAQANNHLIGALTETGRIEEAIVSAREAIRVFSRTYGPNSLQVANDRANLAARLGATGQTAEAASTYASVLSIYESRELAGWDVVAYGQALEGYAQLRADLGHIDEAIVLAEKAVATIDGSNYRDTINYGWVLATLGRLRREDGQCEEAREAFANAVAAMRSAGVAEGHPGHVEARREAARSC